jgi:hypothetical protein
LVDEQLASVVVEGNCADAWKRKEYWHKREEEFFFKLLSLTAHKVCLRWISMPSKQAFQLLPAAMDKVVKLAKSFTNLCRSFLTCRIFSGIVARSLRMLELDIKQ